MTDATIVLRDLLKTYWNKANTDNIVPTIEIIYASGKEIDARIKDWVLLYALPSTEFKQGIDYDFVVVSDPVSIDIRVGRDADGLSTNPIKIRQHAVKVKEEVRRVIYTKRKRPGSGYDELRYNREQDLSDRMRLLFRWVIDSELVSYASALPTAL